MLAISYDTIGKRSLNHIISAYSYNPYLFLFNPYIIRSISIPTEESYILSVQYIRLLLRYMLLILAYLTLI